MEYLKYTQMRVHPPPIAVFRIMCEERERQENLFIPVEYQVKWINVWWLSVPTFKKTHKFNSCRLCNKCLCCVNHCHNHFCYMAKYSRCTSYDDIVTSALKKNPDYNNLQEDPDYPVKLKGIFMDFFKNNQELVRYKSDGKAIDMVKSRLGGWYNVEYVDKYCEMYGSLNVKESEKENSKDHLRFLKLIEGGGGPGFGYFPGEYPRIVFRMDKKSEQKKEEFKSKLSLDSKRKEFRKNILEKIEYDYTTFMNNVNVLGKQDC